MSDAFLREQLARYAAEHAEELAWDDVVRRVRSGRVRVAAAVALVGAAIIVPTALAVPAVRQVFTGTAAPAPVLRAFRSNNRFASKLPPVIAQHSGFGRVDLASARGVVTVRTSEGPIYLWAARQRAGSGKCWFATWRHVPSAATVLAAQPACDPRHDTGSVSFSYVTRLPRPGTAVLVGRAYGPGAAYALVTYSCVHRRRVPVVQGLFLAAFPAGTPVSRVSVQDASGRTIAARRYATGTPSCAAIRRSAIGAGVQAAHGRPSVVAVALTYKPKPNPPGRIVAARKGFSLRARWHIPLSWVSDAFPTRFPPSSRGQICPRGVFLQVWFDGGASRTYGPCHWPGPVQNLAQVMTNELGFVEQRAGLLRPPG